VATVAEAFARVNLLGQLVTWHVDWGQWPMAWSVSWPVVWFGVGLLIFARIMRAGAAMRADIEGTVSGDLLTHAGTNNQAGQPTLPTGRD